jgi:hypothetical protein
MENCKATADVYHNVAWREVGIPFQLRGGGVAYRVAVRSPASQQIRGGDHNCVGASMKKAAVEVRLQGEALCWLRFDDFTPGGAALAGTTRSAVHRAQIVSTGSGEYDAAAGSSLFFKKAAKWLDG